MRTINVEKSKVIETLKNNRETHIEEFKKAKEKFKEVVLDALQEIKTQIDNGDRISFRPITKLTEPVDNTNEYDKAIEMFEIEVKDVIELTTDEFNKYIRDDWDWTSIAKFANTMYIQ